MNYNILITSAGKRVALVRAFKSALNKFFPDGKVYTTDMNPNMAPAGYVSDKCFKVPRVTDDSYIDTLLGVCTRHNIGMVVPTIDTELRILADNKEIFAAKDCAIIISDRQFIDKCRDKRETERFFTESSVTIPRRIDIDNPVFPIFAKPYDGSLSKDIYLIKSTEDITPEIRNNPKLLFMEYIDKSKYKEFTIDMYYGRDHRLKMAVPRERIEIRAGEINKGRTYRGNLVEYIKDRFDKIDGCIGCICMQVFHNTDDNSVVGIEINPRFGGGYPLTHAAGGDFPQLLIKEYFLDEKVEYSDNWTDNMIMLCYDDAVFI